MLVRFLGPISRVTGSCYHLVDDAKGAEYLVDFGLVQGEGQQLAGGDGELPFDVVKIKHIFLTHAHIDHCGLLPLLYRRGFGGRVWCTRETSEIAKINLKDAARLGHVPYTEDDVELIQWWEPKITPLFNRLTPFDTDRFLCFLRSAHIAGAASISLVWGPKYGGQRTIVFSGDLGVNTDRQETQPLLKYRMDPGPVDYAVCESTYGDHVRVPVSWQSRVDALYGALRNSLESSGLAILPAFSIGRSQDLLLDLAVLRAKYSEVFANADVVFHSPMGVLANRIYADAALRTDIVRGRDVKATWLNSRLGEWLGMDRSPEGERLLRELVASVLTGKAPPPGVSVRYPGSIASRLDGSTVIFASETWHPRPGRCTIVICSSGMCTGGPVISYLREYLHRDSTTVVFPGYVAAGTLGHQLLRIRDVLIHERPRLGGSIGNPECPVSWSMRECDVRATIKKVDGYSGHADQTSLGDWLQPNPPDGPAAGTIFLTHGTDNARIALRKHLLERGCRHVELPQHWNRFYDLDLGAWCDTDAPEDEIHRLRYRIAALEEQLARVTSRGSIPPDK